MFFRIDITQMHFPVYLGQGSGLSFKLRVTCEDGNKPSWHAKLFDPNSGWAEFGSAQLFSLAVLKLTPLLSLPQFRAQYFKGLDPA